MTDEGPRIRVTKDGPYQVYGTPPLARLAKIKTEYGEPVDWTSPEPLATGRRFALCRCGRSKTKPFCDDSHLEEPRFDGSEVADRGPRAARAQTFVGETMVLTDDLSLCALAGYCRTRSTSVWEMIEVSSDADVRERLVTMISNCPSGRLEQQPSIAEPAEEPAFEPMIGVTRNGPYWVRGGIPIESEDGQTYEVRNRVTLCRCGQSRNKPFCDGSHSDVGFRDG